MSEAAQRPDYTLPDVEQPTKRPVGVTSRQWRLAALYPRCKTATEALLKAGYAKTTARALQSKILDGIGVQRAKAAQESKKLDSARSINGITAAKLRSRIENDSASDQLILGAYKVTTDAIVAGADDVESVSESDRLDANNYIKAIVERILVATGIDPSVPSTQQLIDNMLVPGPASDNSQYVNSPSPPSTTLLLSEQGITIDAATVATSSVDAPATRPAKRDRKV